MFDIHFYGFRVERFFLRFKGGDKPDSGRDAVAGIEIDFGRSFVNVRLNIHQTEVFPVKVFAGFRVTDCEIGIDYDVIQCQLAFVAKGDLIMAKHHVNQYFGFGA